MQSHLFISVSFLIGSMALLILGMRALSKSVQFQFTQTLRKTINIINENPFKSIFSGFSTALLNQSKTSTYGGVLSYSDSGLFSQTQVSLFLIGANLGSFLAIWIFAIDIMYLEYFTLGVGILCYAYCPWQSVKNTGQFILSVGLLLLGYKSFIYGLESGYSVFKYIPLDFTASTELMFVGILMVAAGVTALVRSSVVILALIMAAVQIGELNTVTAAQIVLGVNLGGAFLGLSMSKRSSRKTKRAFLQNTLGLIISVLVFYVFFSMALDFSLNLVEEFGFKQNSFLVKNYAYLSVPLFHLIFNISAFIIGCILYWPIKQLVDVGLSDKSQKTPQKMLHAHGTLNLPSSIAVEHLYQEVKKMAALLDSVLLLSFKEKSDVSERIKKYEEITNKIEDEIIEYAKILFQSELSYKLVTEVHKLVTIADHLESLADYCKYMLERVSTIDSEQEREQIYKNFDDEFNYVISEYEHFFAKLTRHDFLTQLSKENLRAKYGSSKQLQAIREKLIENKQNSADVKSVSLDLVDCLRDISEVNRLLNNSVKDW